MRHALAALFLVACGQPTPTPAKPPAGGGGSAASAPTDAPAVSQEETLAAIQKAMNDLHGGAQGCWAVAATDRYDFSGDLVVRIDVGPVKSTAAVVRDNVHADKLVACMSQLLGAYKYPPPLYGQTIQLPFDFKKVDGQSVIDRQLVEAHGQLKVAVSVLLDEANTGNAAASMFELAIAPGGTTGMRVADRAEVWYFLTNASLKQVTNVVTSKAVPDGASPGRMVASATVNVSAGSVMFVPKGGEREVYAVNDNVRAVVVVSPGGHEGSARAGALPMQPSQGLDKTPPRPQFLKGTQYGPAQIFLDASIVKDTPMAASILTLAEGAKVPEHVHANETEMLYVLEGSGTMTIAGTDVAVTPTSVIQIPPNTKHAFAATSAVKSLQIYTPAGPEQRFKKKP